MTIWRKRPGSPGSSPPDSAPRAGVTWRGCGTTWASPARRFRPTCQRVPRQATTFTCRRSGAGSITRRPEPSMRHGSVRRVGSLPTASRGTMPACPTTQGESVQPRAAAGESHRADRVRPFRAPGSALASATETEIAAWRQTPARRLQPCVLHADALLVPRGRRLPGYRVVHEPGTLGASQRRPRDVRTVARSSEPASRREAEQRRRHSGQPPAT